MLRVMRAADLSEGVILAALDGKSKLGTITEVKRPGQRGKDTTEVRQPKSYAPRPADLREKITVTLDTGQVLSFLMTESVKIHYAG